MKNISSKSDEGALRHMTPKNTNFYVLTDFSAPYTLTPSSSRINFKWNSIGHANGIISMHKLTWGDGVGPQPRKASNLSVISAQSSDLQRPPVGGALNR